jgi:hypothetical protein
MDRGNLWVVDERQGLGHALPVNERQGRRAQEIVWSVVEGETSDDSSLCVDADQELSEAYRYLHTRESLG